MRLLEAIPELSELPGPLFLAIGVFDGVHLGHQAVICESVQDARASGGTAVVVTFSPHPQRVLRPDVAPRILTSTPHKLRLLRALHVTHTLVVRFDSAFAATEPDAFIRDLQAHSNPLGGISVGREWSFGRGRAGNLALLRQLGEKLGFKVTGVPEVTLGEDPISSTLIRSAVRDGDLGLASQLLGRPYGLWGRVERGRQLGRTLGFPTANLSTHSEQFPPDGVYAVTAILPDASRHRAVTNIGVRPTVDGTHRTLEVHIPNFEGDLYDQDLEIVFLRKLRDEQRFDSLDALKSQISQDVQAALAL